MRYASTHRASRSRTTSRRTGAAPAGGSSSTPATCRSARGQRPGCRSRRRRGRESRRRVDQGDVEYVSCWTPRHAFDIVVRRHQPSRVPCRQVGAEQNTSPRTERAAHTLEEHSPLGRVKIADEPRNAIGSRGQHGFPQVLLRSLPTTGSTTTGPRNSATNHLAGLGQLTAVEHRTAPNPAERAEGPGQHPHRAAEYFSEHAAARLDQRLRTDHRTRCQQHIIKITHSVQIRSFFRQPSRSRRKTATREHRRGLQQQHLGVLVTRPT